MTPWHRFHLVLSAWLLAGAAQAATAPACTPVPWDPVWSIDALPPEVQAILHDASAIADAGADFNATDLLRDGLPRRRLIMGVIGAGCVHVSVELGGRGLTRYRQIFQRIGTHWQLVAEEVLPPPSREAATWIHNMQAPPKPFR